MSTRLITAALLGGLLLAALPHLAMSQEKAPADKAIIVVKLPADAKLTLQGDPTRAVGAERRFVTPALQMGLTYSYTFVATWTENDKEQKAEKKVSFEAGQTVEVVFGKAAPKDKGKADKKEEAYQAAMKKGAAAMKAKKYVDALGAYAEALRQKPKDPDAIKGDEEAARLLVEQEEARKAEEDKKKKDEEKESKDEILPPPRIENL